jgi:hypothetical protein
VHVLHPLPQEAQAGYAGDGEDADVEQLVELVVRRGEPEEEGDGSEGEGQQSRTGG